jgi:hypothetical protein
VVTDVVADEAQAPSEMKFEPPVLPNELAPCEITACPFSLTTEPKVKSCGQEYCFKDLYAFSKGVRWASHSDGSSYQRHILRFMGALLL